jgi:hypothetical protein
MILSLHHRILPLLACLLFTQSALAKDPTKPGLMRQAIAHLEGARHTSEPLVSLRAARRAVVNAHPNKGGERKEAIHAIDQAIQAAEAGDKQTMNAKIAHAIYDLKQGMNNAK